MANILEKYGIKEVADVMFYEIDETGAAGAPVLYLDTLKVSTIEQTGEESEARGGKGNSPLVIWDYGKDINVTLEDALFSAKSMAILFGNGKADATSQTIKKTIPWVPTSADASAPTTFEGPGGETYSGTLGSVYDAKGSAVTSYNVGETYYVTLTLNATDATVIEISPNTFPGAYYVTGDTYARSEKTGKDEFFQFIIPKAKVKSENTISLEAEGDPTVFNLSLRVLRPAGGGAMMKLVKYSLDAVQG